MLHAIQMVEAGRDYADARAIAIGLGRQEGCIAARVCGDGSRGKPYAAQALFIDDDGPRAGEWLPDGCRRVIVPGSFPLAVAV